jgi:MFS family permease
VTPTELDLAPANRRTSRTAFRFVLLIGILSFFADFTYEGSRSILGPFLAVLGASGTIVGVVTGFGELLGYGLRLVSGRLADATGRFWPITIVGYVVQMASVPALALVDSWPAAAALIILERVGKAVRNPPRDVMLSHAAKQVGGYGWVFGLHEALDQFGAMFGPLAVAAVLAHKGDYQLAFGVLLVPALINLAFVLAARLLYPRPQDLETAPPPNVHG